MFVTGKFNKISKVKKNEYRSVSLTRFCMKIVGFWRADTKFDQRLMNLALFHAIFAITFGITIQAVEMYHCIEDEDLYVVMCNLCTTMIMVIILVKIGNFMYYRDIVIELITYAEKNFWSIEYDDYGTKVLQDCDRKGIIFTYTFTFIVQAANFNYIFVPLIENRGRNETDRLLPFKLWVNLPVTTTPYYEVTYTIQSLSTLHSGICTFCFDNFLCCFNIHVAGQMKILAHKFEVVVDRYLESVDKNVDTEKVARSACNEFVNCVLKHLKIIKYVDSMKSAFTWILFGQLLLSSLIICFAGFLFLAAETWARKFIFVLHFTGSISQLFLHAWTCHEITYQSEGISKSVYNMKWYKLPHDKCGKMIKHGIMMVMFTLHNPCVLKAGKFAPMSLETFRSILSTAASYFALLRQVGENIEETLLLYHVGVLYFCFDNLLCILNIHVNGQFRILNRRLKTICDTRSMDEFQKTEKPDQNKRYILDPYNSFKKLNDCIRHHQSLIKFVDRMEKVFRITILGQVLVFSGLICLVSYQAFLVGGPFLRRIIFIVHCAGTFTQLFMFTLTCHDLWESSICVADGLYKSGWYLLPESDEYTKRLRKNIILILMRIRRPCHLTAFGFFPISLETFMTINSTAVSYLTILRQSAA